MSKPYIVCYMMISVDGRIDCATTEQLPGVEDYDPLLAQPATRRCSTSRTPPGVWQNA